MTIKGLQVRTAIDHISVVTGLEPGDVVSGVTLSAGDAVLVYAHLAPTARGIWVVQPTGSAIRHPEFAAWDDFPGALFSVTEGTYGGELWRCTSASGGNIATDMLTFQRQQSDGRISATSLLTGRGTTNESAAVATLIAAASTSGSVLYFPKGTYRFAVTIGVPVFIRCHPEAVFINPFTNNPAQAIFHFVQGAEGAVFDCHGVLDGNRDDPAVVAGWAETAFTMGMAGIRVHCANVKIRGRPTLRNWCRNPAYFTGDYLDCDGFTVEDSGDAAMFYWGDATLGFANAFDSSDTPTGRPAGRGCVGQNVRNLTYKRIDNKTYAYVWQHAMDVWQPLNGVYENILIEEQGGNSLGYSIYASGLTISQPMFTKFDGITVNNMVASIRHLGISFAGGGLGCTLDNIRVYKYAGMGLELNTGVAMAVNNVYLDGGGQSSPVLTADQGNGLGWSAADFNGDPRYRGKAVSREVVVNNLVIRRVGLGGYISGNFLFNGGSIIGCGSDGLRIVGTPGDAFPGAVKSKSVVRLNGMTIRSCGRQGVRVHDDASKVSLHINGCDISGNGVNISWPSEERCGVYGQHCSELIVSSSQVTDDKNDSVVRGASYLPGDTTQITPSDHRYDIYVREPWHYNVGDRVTLVGVGAGGASIIGKVQNVVNDRITLTFATAQTFDASAAMALLQDLSGTWSGTSPLTGTGGAALSEIGGFTWVTTDGTDFRLVKLAQSNSSLTVLPAFSPKLSEATLKALCCTIHQIKSQQVGITVKGTVDRFVLTDIDYGGASGNVLMKNVIQDPSKAGDKCEYYRETTVDVAGNTTTDLIGGIPGGHLPRAQKFQITVGITTATVMSLVLANSSGSTVHTHATGLPVAKNTQAYGPVVTPAFGSNGHSWRASFNVAPTAGQIRTELMFKVDRPAAWANVA